MHVVEAKPSSDQFRRQALGSLAKLPPFSAVMNKLMATLACDDVSLGAVAAVIEQDAVLSGNVLKIVNSAAYGRRGTVNTLRHAVSMLGLAKVRNTAMSLSVSQMWGRLDLHPQWSPKQFYLHSTAAATMADLMALEIDVEYPEGAFTAGLLSGVGMLLIATALRQEFTQLNRCYAHNAETGSGSLAGCEEAMLGFAHNDLSADVLDHWNLPAPIVEAVRHLQAPKAGTLANVVARAIDAAAQSGYPIQSWVRPAAGEALATLEAAGMDGKAERVLTQFQEQMNALLPFA